LIFICIAAGLYPGKILSYRRRFAWNGNMDGCRLGFGAGVFKLKRKGKVVEFVASVCYLYISRICLR
jgi:hypothetical protein